jgi:DNA-binding LytR/AlgR family response regulator
MIIDGIHIHPEAVEYAQAKRNYTLIVLCGNKTVMSAWNLGVVCERLQLARVHRSFGVNSNLVVEKTEKSLKMKSGFLVKTSPRMTGPIEDMFQ